MYNKFMEQKVITILFGLYVIISFSLSLFYLRYRRCSWLEILGWGFVALAIPVLGPFFVIAARPGPRKRTRNPSSSLITGPSKG